MQDGQGSGPIDVDADHMADTVAEGNEVVGMDIKAAGRARRQNLHGPMRKRARAALAIAPGSRVRTAAPATPINMQSLVEDSLRMALPGFLNSLSQGIKDELAPIINDHGAKLAAQGRSIDVFQEEVGRHDVRLDSLERTLKQAQEEGVSSTTAGFPSGESTGSHTHLTLPTHDPA